MTHWDDFGYEDTGREPDTYQISVRERLRDHFEQNDTAVFFGGQLAVQNEDVFFHWITHRAISDLISEGIVLSERRKLVWGNEIKLLWHRRNRYYRRDAKRVVSLVEEYGDPAICDALGWHGEQMILAGFASRQFIQRGRNTRTFGDREWTDTKHNLDFIFERDGKAYGIEVKNTLSYMDQAEFDIKIKICTHLGITPVFCARMLPKVWIHELAARGGYAMILKYQLYPWTHTELAQRVSKGLGLPVDAPRALKDGTMDRFERWLRRRL